MNTKCSLFKFGFVLVFVLVSTSVLIGCSNESSPRLVYPEYEYSITQDIDHDYIVYLKNETPAVSVLWDYVWGASDKQSDTVRIPAPGKYTIRFSLTTKSGTASFSEDIVVTQKDPERFSQQEWKLLTNYAEGKTWWWDNSSDCYGTGAYLIDTEPGILGYTAEELEEKKIADDEVFFDLNGSQNMTLISPLNQVEKGGFSIDMNDKIEGWSIGKLTTSGFPIMGGYDDNNGSTPIYEYHILKLTEDELSLCAAIQGAQKGDEALYWKLKAKKWNLVWEDTFNGPDGSKPDDAKWDFPEYDRRVNVDGPDGYWSKEDVYLENNELVIRIRKLDSGDYSTGAIRTKGKEKWANGKFEIKCQLPKEQGWWVAFWMMTGDVGSIGNGSSDGAELDIMEAWGWTDQINHAIHWDGYGDAHKSEGFKHEVEGIREGYHIYTLEWHPGVYIFFVDNEEVWRTTADGVCNYPGYLQITGECSTESWAINDHWALDPRQATYPDYFRVDWVRVYQY